MGLNRKDGAGALLAASDSVSGLLGSVAALLVGPHRVTRPPSPAPSARPPTRSPSPTPTRPLGAIEHLKSDDLGRAGILLGGSPAADADWPGLPGDATYAVDVVECPAELRPALTRLLFKIAVVDDLPAARALVAEAPDVTAVTRDGDVLGAHFASGGSSAQPSADRGPGRGRRGRRPARRGDRGGGAAHASRPRAWRPSASTRRSAPTSRWPSCTSPTRPWPRWPRSSASTARRPAPPAARPTASTSAIAKAEEARERDLAGLAELETRLAAAEDSPEEEPDTTERERLAEAARAARQGEMDARLALRTSEERARALHGRADALLRSARPEREARARAAERRERMIREGRAAEAVGLGVGSRARPPGAPRSTRPPQARTAVEQARAGREERAARPPAAGCATSTASTTSWSTPSTATRWPAPSSGCASSSSRSGRSRSSGSTPRRSSRLRPRATSSRSPARSRRAPTTPEPTPYVREEQVKRLRSAERSLAMLGKVNPLALEEFSAMEERHKFLTEQLEDLKKTRTDLLDIVREVDARVEQVFTEAWDDVAGRLRPRLLAAVPRRRGPADPHRPRRHAHHRHRGRGPPAGQEGQAALAALRWRAVAGRGGVPGRAVQGPSVAVLHPRRGRGRARRHQPRPAAGDLRGAARELPAPGDHPPEADHGGRRRAVRRDHARRRRLHGDQPAAPRGRAGDDRVPARPRPRARLRRVAHRHDPLGATTTSTAT